jgi:asparagine synthase (glutamine-hydrolysing)
MLRGIEKLLPGHALVVEDGTTRVTRFWDPLEEPFGDEQPATDEDALARQVAGLLDDAVRLRMVADVPVGAFLSGGLDSSAVVALMRRHTEAPVQTFALGFDARGHDETADARAVATALGTDHHELRVAPGELVEHVRRLAYQYDEPFGDAAAFPLFLLSRLASAHVKVVLTGDGGDELFGGYRRYVAEQFAPGYQRLPRALTRALPGAVERLPRLRRTKQLFTSLAERDPALRYASWLTVFTPELMADVLVTPHSQADVYRPHFAASRGADRLNALMYADVKTWLADDYMEKTDKATMAWGLEARTPFLDPRLVELALRIPARAKIRGVSTKLILRRAVGDLVPPAVLRKRKHGFSVPTDAWFRGELAAFARDVLLDERTRARGVFAPAAVERLWREHREGRQVRDTALWLLLVFELWARIYLDGEPV